MEFFTDIVDEFPFKALKDELEEIFGISEISPEYLQDETIAPLTINTYRNYHQKRERLMLILHFWWLMLNLHFEILKIILE